MVLCRGIVHGSQGLISSGQVPDTLFCKALWFIDTFCHRLRMAAVAPPPSVPALDSRASTGGGASDPWQLALWRSAD